MLADLVRGNVDVLFICETKIDQTFPSSQFVIPGFTTLYRLDRTGSGGGWEWGWYHAIHQGRHSVKKNSI